MENQVSESVVRRIQLLFQLAQRGTNNDGKSNEHEAATAMAKAQELLAKYNLDLATVQDAKVAGGTAVQEEARGKEQLKRTAMYDWQQRLCRAIAEANFCVYWVTTVREENKVNHKMCSVKRHVLLGRESNVVAATMMYDYLIGVIEANVPERGTKDIVSRSANSWRQGCADRLIERIEEKAERMKREGTSTANVTCTALAMQDLHEKEYAANYDAQYGVGAYARMKARHAEWEANAAARHVKQEAEREAMLAGETPEQRTAREKAEAKAAAKQQARDARWWQAQRNRQYREAAKRDVAAYARGSHKGSQIGLDSQLNQATKKGELK